MLRSILAKTLRDQRRPLLWWSLGVVALTALVLLSYPSFRDDTTVNELVAELPEAFRAMIGGETDLTSPVGYLQARLFALLVPLFFLVYGINLGVGAVAGEEEQGTLDLLLALPITRRRVVLEKFAALSLLLLAFAVVFWLALWLGARSVEMAIAIDRLAAATAGTLLLALTFGTFGLALGAATGRRGPALGLTAAIAAATYVLNGFAPTVDALRPLRRLSPFSYADAAGPLRGGFDLPQLAVLVAASAVLLTIAVLTFDRRDIAV